MQRFHFRVTGSLLRVQAAWGSDVSLLQGGTQASSPSPATCSPLWACRSPCPALSSGVVCSLPSPLVLIYCLGGVVFSPGLAHGCSYPTGHRPGGGLLQYPGVSTLANTSGPRGLEMGSGGDLAQEVPPQGARPSITPGHHRPASRPPLRSPPGLQRAPSVCLNGLGQVSSGPWRDTTLVNVWPPQYILPPVPSFPPHLPLTSRWHECAPSTGSSPHVKSRVLRKRASQLSLTRDLVPRRSISWPTSVPWLLPPDSCGSFRWPPRSTAGLGETWARGSSTGHSLGFCPHRTPCLTLSRCPLVGRNLHLLSDSAGHLPRGQGPPRLCTSTGFPTYPALPKASRLCPGDAQG